LGRRRYRRRHPPSPRRRSPRATHRLFGWVAAVPIIVPVFWFADTRSGLLKPDGSPLLALLIDIGVVAVAALVVTVRRVRR
jgi:uncharacterized membrane protein